MKARLFSALALAGVAALAQAGGATENDAAEKSIRAALATWVDAANRGDYKAALAVWAPDMIGWAAAGPDDSYEREAAGAKQPAPKQVMTTYALTIDEVIVDGSLAVVRDTWTQTTKQHDGPDKSDTFRSFEVWRRQADASWKISRWIDGPMLPAAKK